MRNRYSILFLFDEEGASRGMNMPVVGSTSWRIRIYRRIQKEPPGRMLCIFRASDFKVRD